MPKTAKWVIIAIIAMLVVVLVMQTLVGCAPAREKPSNLRPEPATPTMKAPGEAGSKATSNQSTSAPSNGGG